MTAKICPGAAGDCATPTSCARDGCRYFLVPPIGCLHFVGFRDERYRAAVRAFGPPDFTHRVWDERARREVGPRDAVVFAEGDEYQPTGRLDKTGVWRWHGWDDSREDIVARGGERDR